MRGTGVDQLYKTHPASLISWEMKTTIPMYIHELAARYTHVK